MENEKLKRGEDEIGDKMEKTKKKTMGLKSLKD